MVANLNDNTQSWNLLDNGSYNKIKPDKKENFSAHDYFMNNPSLSGRGSTLNEFNYPELDLTSIEKS